MKKVPVILAGAYTSNLVNNRININKKLAIKPINI